MNVLLPALVWLSAASPPSAGILAEMRGGPPSLPAAQEGSEFRRSYENAMKINAVEEMGRLIRRNDHEAVVWILETCEAISERSSDTLEERLAALRVGWQRGMETDFVNRVYTYLSLLSPVLKRERLVMRERYEKALRSYHENVAAKNDSTFVLLANEFRGLADAFAQVGDHYHASQAWLFYGLCHNDQNRGKKADLYEACLGYKNSLTARDAWELKDRTYNETRVSHGHLSSQGFDARPGAGPGGEPGGAGPELGAATAVRASLAFELVPRLDAVERPNYQADDFYQTWDALAFQARGTQASFAKLEALSPVATRRGDSEVVIEVQGPSGKLEIPLPMTGKLEPVQFEIGTGEERRPWAALTTLGIQNDQYQGLQLNLAPSTGFLSVYWINAGSMVGSVAGTRLQVFDDNLDGIYGSAPRSWQNMGMTEGHFHPEMDCILVGAEKRARPWSEYAKIGDAWYRLQAAQGGKALEYAPAEVQTGFLSLEYSGSLKPTWLVVRGSGRWENSYFDLAAARGKGAEVPAGRYSLFYGEVRKGRRAQTQKTLIVPGKETPVWEVRAGEVTKVALGAPYSFDFKVQVSGGELVVPGKSVVVVGSAGERYERAWNAVASPEVAWREVGSRRASKAHEMPALLDTDPMYSEGWHVAWFPRDLRLPLPPGTGKIEVQLAEKKHKLFGKIESGWKE